jgi:1-acyl-sn-glycerol-3-phosphate acyltransferase
MRITERSVRLPGSALARRLLRLAGWKVVFDGLPARQGVVIIYPHTSNWDFLIGILAKWAIGIPAAFFIKDSFFKVPLFSRWIGWLGGFPIDRRAPNGIVGQMGEALLAARARNRFLWLAITPEGTRSYRDAWRSGFYHVTLAARVPLGLAAFDYARREVRFDTFVQLSGNADADMAEIAAVLGQATGKRPDLAAPIRLKP